MSVLVEIYIITSLILSFNVIITISRGPHHPRGHQISEQHVHYRPKRQQGSSDDDYQHSLKITQDTQLLHDKEHIQEDLADMAIDRDLESMSDEELEFYYFKLHDFDNNTQLDGLEILQAIQHTSNHDENHDDSPLDFDYFIELIDQVLAEDDTNQDGYLSYPEYVLGRMKNSVPGDLRHTAIKRAT